MKSVRDERKTAYTTHIIRLPTKYRSIPWTKDETGTRTRTGHVAKRRKYETSDVKRRRRRRRRTKKTYHIYLMMTAVCWQNKMDGKNDETSRERNECAGGRTSAKQMVCVCGATGVIRFVRSSHSARARDHGGGDDTAIYCVCVRVRATRLITLS